ncbi:MAG: hypothetical protein QM674_02345 [Burkholderiaceae bacterium]
MPDRVTFDTKKSLTTHSVRRRIDERRRHRQRPLRQSNKAAGMAIDVDVGEAAFGHRFAAVRSEPRDSVTEVGAAGADHADPRCDRFGKGRSRGI